jgi:hypothetical protein
LVTGEAVGTLVGTEPEGTGEVGEEAEGTGEPDESSTDGITLATPFDWDGVGDSPEVASRAPAAMIRTTHATPRMADRLRQLESFT